MRVLCIQDSPKEWQMASGPFKIKIGGIYKVVKEHIMCNRLYYELDIDHIEGYLYSLFVPLSDFTIEELIGERELVEV